MVLPVVSNVRPISGSFYGGQTVTLTGSGFLVSPPSVLFGALAGTSVVVASDTELSVVAPYVGFEAEVFVTVTTTAGTSLNSQESLYFYFNPVSSPNYGLQNPFFDPLANYVCWGNWTFAKPVELSLIVAGSLPVVSPVAAPPAVSLPVGYAYLVVETATGVVGQMS